MLKLKLFTVFSFVIFVASVATAQDGVRDAASKALSGFGGRQARVRTSTPATTVAPAPAGEHRAHSLEPAPQAEPKVAATAPSSPRRRHVRHVRRHSHQPRVFHRRFGGVVRDAGSKIRGDYDN